MPLKLGWTLYLQLELATTDGGHRREAEGEARGKGRQHTEGSEASGRSGIRGAAPGEDRPN